MNQYSKMVEVESSKVLEAIKILVSPVNLKEDDTGGKKFADFLHKNVLELRCQLETKYKDLHDLLGVSSRLSNENDVRWEFVLWNLRLLSVLRCSMEKAMSKQEMDRTQGDVLPLSADLLSFTQQKTVLMSVQLVVCLGICPGLLPGVGVPVERRSQYWKLVRPGDCEGMSREVCDHRLLLCLQELLSCIRSVTLRSLILPRHLSDLLAALCQLCYGPKSAPMNTPKSCDSSTSIAGQSTDPGTVQAQSQHILLCKLESDNKRVSAGLENNSTPSQCHNSRSSPCEHSVQAPSRENPGNVVLPPASGRERATEVLLLDEELGPRRCKEELQRLLDEAPKHLLMRDLLLLQSGLRITTAKTGRCPVWLQKASGRLLAQQLTLSGGIQHILNAMLQGQNDSVDWRKCDAVAQIIARCPHQMMSEEYYRQVTPQLIELLHMNEHQVSPLYIRVAVITIVAMTTQDKDAAQRLLITPLLNPLLQCTEGRQGDCQPVAGEELSQCILDIHKVFVVGSEPHSPLLNALQPVLHVLFRLYCFIKSGVSHLRQLVEDILVTFLRQTDHQVALAVLHLMAFGDVHDRPTVMCVRMSDHLDFTQATTGGVVVATKCASLTQSVFDMGKWENTCQCIVHLLKQLNMDKLTAEFFLLLLKELTAIVSEEACVGIQLAPGRSESERRRVGRNLEVLALLAALSEHIDPSCFNSTQHILQLAQVTIERGVKVLEHTSDETLGVFETDTLTMAMGLLTAVLSHPHKLTNADRDQSKSLLPLLQHIATNHSDPTVQEMATDLRIAIATHRIVLSELAKQRAADVRGAGHNTKEKVQSAMIGGESVRSEVNRSTGHRSAPLIEVLSSCDSDDIDVTSAVKFVTKTGDTDMTSAVKCVNRNDVERTSDGRDQVHAMSSRNLTGDIVPHSGDTMSSSDTMSTDVTSTGMTTSTCDTTSTCVTTSVDVTTSSSDASPLEQALVELCDSLVPVRGHALITLTHLLQQRDPSTLAHSNMLQTIFSKNLDHPDTYIYLQAVSGLATLGESTPDTVLPTLLQEYSRRSHSIELRVKLGEAIVRISRRLGDMIPAYRDALLGVLLCVVRDTEPLVRASCLSNLGDVCKLLRFSLGNVIHEVFEVTSHLLKTDPNPEVRKAAALFLTLLLQGMDINTIQVLDTVLRDLYRLLKFVMFTECEEMVKVHVQLALEELDTISRRLLFPPQTLTKKISILHP